jgi:hypothetical protein
MKKPDGALRCVNFIMRKTIFDHKNAAVSMRPLPGRADGAVARVADPYPHCVTGQVLSVRAARRMVG